MSKVFVNEPVVVASVGFRKNLIAYPKRIEFRGSTYDFIDKGLRCLVRTGGRLSEIITLTDGVSEYCLRSANRGVDWILLSITT